MKPRVYIETTVPSAYHEVRRDAETVAKRRWTREWWDGERTNLESVTSEPVLNELSAGEYPNQDGILALVAELPLVRVVADIEEIVDTYIKRMLMPANRTGDALHLALASYHECDLLVTWNCRHIANANKFGHIRLVNEALGLFVPTIVTPFELLGG